MRAVGFRGKIGAVPMTATDRLPRLGGRLFLGAGGLETTMIFTEGIELPCFASFVLLAAEGRREALRRYYVSYIEIARRHGLGFTLDTPTWRASADWGAKLGYGVAELDEINRFAISFAQEIRAAEETDASPIAVCGTVGPRGDAYHPASVMSAEQAQHYHAAQIATFSEAGADMVSAYTLGYASEAIGLVRAATACDIRISISFTVETDGRLPSGQPLDEAIEQVDAESDRAAAFFMINCAHPTHFAASEKCAGTWLQRLGGVRANASPKSHAELDRATELDPGDPAELAAGYRALKPHLASVRVLGGCCGTDNRHVARICAEWLNRGLR